MSRGHDQETIGFMALVRKALDTWKKRPTSPASGHQGNGEPCKTFEEIVGERHERETVSLGNSAFSGPSWTKVAEVDVSDQIGYFGELGCERS